MLVVVVLPAVLTLEVGVVVGVLAVEEGEKEEGLLLGADWFICLSVLSEFLAAFSVKCP